MTFPPRPNGPGDPWPTLSDEPPGRFTGVPVERDPRTGKLLSGDPGGRSDKGRSTRPSRTVSLATAGALVVAAVVAVVVLNRGNDDPTPAAASTSTAAPTTTTATTPPPPVDPGPRTVPVTLTAVSVTPPPGFGPDPAFGTVGEVRSRTWNLTGPCDGTGACTIEHCTAPGTCLPPLVATPNGSGYVATVVVPVNWVAASCSGVGGQITDTVTFTISGDPLAPQITGDWVENASPVVFTAPDGGPCGIYLGHYTLASA